MVGEKQGSRDMIRVRVRGLIAVTVFVTLGRILGAESLVSA